MKNSSHQVPAAADKGLAALVEKLLAELAQARAEAAVQVAEMRARDEQAKKAVAARLERFRESVLADQERANRGSR